MKFYDTTPSHTHNPHPRQELVPLAFRRVTDIQICLTRGLRRIVFTLRSVVMRKKGKESQQKRVDVGVCACEREAELISSSC